MGEVKRGRTWVLDTETKGTGAEMVPLDKLVSEKSLRGRGERISVVRKPRVSEPEAPVEVAEGSPAQARRPREFKLVNVVNRQLVAEHVDAREVVSLLENVPSLADVQIYVWQPTLEGWRPLRFDEKQAFWSFRSDNARRSWDGRHRDGQSAEGGPDSAVRTPGLAEKLPRRRRSAAHLEPAGRVRPRLGRAPRSRAGGNR
jgi:hypothetical protein